MEKIRRPHTSKRVLRAIERALHHADKSSMDREAKRDFRMALRWLGRVREYKRFKNHQRKLWQWRRERGE